ncbi:MBL fold metallo-hydrolase [Plastoroseomonas arctica]|uniref:MBL fold metallo-hydrolase n=1 Tax=Plastoroseomonas arctica TaxID=1509237 RepID=A0AAF1JY47_9PROT|nr:MBL fold metallo-hydrolase [Plastoroseomonas arctica]MBR0653493.1 MBL fold metallo-hydrolase [Plastoroseomonas arctica]
MSIVHVREDNLPHGAVEDTAPGVRRIICANPGPFTFRGTNTYIIGSGRVAVLDPGPADAAHLDAIRRATDGEVIERILVSHTHRDHSPGAAPLQALTGAPTLGFGRHAEGADGGDHDFSPDEVLPDGALVEGDTYRLTAIHTPGHCANHLCFAMEGGVMFSADHVMGWSTTVVGPPDGNMADYMTSLAKLAARDGDAPYLPGHGPAIHEPAAYVAALAAHRREREQRVVDALAAHGPATVDALVMPVYGPTLDARLVGAAARSLLAHLIKLEHEGAARQDGPLWRRA